MDIPNMLDTIGTKGPNGNRGGTANVVPTPSDSKSGAVDVAQTQGDTKGGAPSAVQTPDNNSAEPENNSNNKKPKKKRKKRYYVGAVLAAIFAAGIGINAVFPKFFPFVGKQIGNWAGTAISGIEDLINGNSISQDELSQLADSVSVDEAGVVSATLPVGVKFLEEASEDKITDLFYYLALEYETYYLGNGENKVPLIEVTDDPRGNENVRYFKTEGGVVATDYIGLQSNYAKFLTAVDEIKALIASGKDKKYSTPLNEGGYDVADVYWIPKGYELYSEDKEALAAVQLLWVCPDDGRTLYLIPKEHVGSIIAVTSDIHKHFTKADALKAQLIEMYVIYSQSAGNMGYNNDAQANRPR